MKILTVDAVIVCRHEQGRVEIQASQHLVTINGRPVLVEPDPEGRKVKSCPNRGPTILPCLKTLAVRAGYSARLRIQGRRVCLDIVTGRTTGTPPGTVDYIVRRPGQVLVSEGP